MTRMELTELEKDVLLFGFGHNNFGDFINDPLWSDCIVDTCEIVTEAQISGVMGSLTKKGLIDGNKAGKDSTTWLTEKGVEVYVELGGDYELCDGEYCKTHWS